MLNPQPTEASKPDALEQGSTAMDCKATKTKITEADWMNLLLDPAAASPAARQHVDACAACRQELAAFAATMQAMDAWEAPEPSPYFDVRMAALLREEKASAPAGFWERVRARLLYSSNLHLRPIAAGALALLLMAGGGAAIFLERGGPPARPQESATVRDLQSLDGNAQVFQQLSSLDADLDDSGSSATN